MPRVLRPSITLFPVAASFTVSPLRSPTSLGQVRSAGIRIVNSDYVARFCRSTS